MHNEVAYILFFDVRRFHLELLLLRPSSSAALNEDHRQWAVCREAGAPRTVEGLGGEAAEHDALAYQPLRSIIIYHIHGRIITFE